MVWDLELLCRLYTDPHTENFRKLQVRLGNVLWPNSRFIWSFNWKKHPYWKLLFIISTLNWTMCFYIFGPLESVSCNIDFFLHSLLLSYWITETKRPPTMFAKSDISSSLSFSKHFSISKIVQFLCFRSVKLFRVGSRVPWVHASGRKLPAVGLRKLFHWKFGRRSLSWSTSSLSRRVWGILNCLIKLTTDM